jgi:flagellar motor switch protein FliM
VTDETDNEPILTDEEIDALVEHAETSDDFDDGQFRTHDFGAGEAVTLAKWRELDGLLRGHAEAIEGVFQFAFDLEATVEPFAPMFALNKDLLAAMPERLCMVSTPIGPVDGDCHVVLPGPLLSFLVNEYFGGAAVEPPRLAGKVTPSEQRLGERLTKEFLRVMGEIWSDRLPLKFGDLYIDNTPDRLTLIPGMTGFVVLTFLITVGDRHRSELRLLMPFEGLEPFANNLMPKQAEEEPVEIAPDWQTGLRAAVPDIPVEVAGVLTGLETTIRSLLAMHVGMVIPIDAPEEIRLQVDGRNRARGGYGSYEGQMAMQFMQFEGQNK